MKHQILLADSADQSEINSAKEAKKIYAKNYSLLVV